MCTQRSGTIHPVSTPMSDMLSDLRGKLRCGPWMSEGRTKRGRVPPPRSALGLFDVSRGTPMQLSGLIPAALRDRGLARARDLARKASDNGGFIDSDSLEVTAPASLRPFVVATVAGDTDLGGAG